LASVIAPFRNTSIFAEENFSIALIWRKAARFASIPFTAAWKMVGNKSKLNQLSHDFTPLHGNSFHTMLAGFDKFAMNPTSEQMAFIGNQGHIIITDPATHQV
jgi:hypothetical protein